VRKLFKVLLALFVIAACLLGWAFWYYRPTLEDRHIHPSFIK
jgi:hypothetical protein